MEPFGKHQVLVAGESFDSSRAQVEAFFAHTPLLNYDRVETPAAEALHGPAAGFFAAIDRAERQNRKVAQDLFDELTKTGLAECRDLLHIEQGYRSKTLHILSHFLDGFIGIDSSFYNLLDDSHWLSAATAERIRARPEKYWLIQLNGFTTSPAGAGHLHL